MQILAMLTIMAIAAQFLLHWHIWYEHGTSKQLSVHQEEWDLVKENLLLNCNNISKEERKDLIFKAYYDYCERLWKTKGSFGACFPRM